MSGRYEIEPAEHLQWNDIVEFFDKSFDYRMHPPQCKQITFYDTFDWRFYSNNLTLSESDQEFTLAPIDSPRPVCRFKWTRKTPYRYPGDHSDPELAARFTKLQDVRSVLPVASVDILTESCDVLNSDRKVISRIKLEEVSVDEEKIERILTIDPVKGYDEEHDLICRSLSAPGLDEMSAAPPLLMQICEHLAIKPGTYSSKIKSVLAPEMSPQQAAALLISEMLTVIQANEQGIIDCIDTEFLHDFRVAVRRIRALLSQMKTVFSIDATEAMKNDFSALGKMTNRLRDCDVLVHAREQYETMLPAELREGLKLFFRSIKDVQRRETRNLVDYLKSDKYHKVINRWQQYIDKKLHSANKKSGDATILQLSGKVIIKRYNKITDKISEITSETPDEFIHALRIDCKKLRYSLEFFASLYPDDSAESISRLKTIQTLLGNFNDLSVQISELNRKINRLPAGKKSSIAMAASLGGLIAVLAINKDELRQNCLDALMKFAAESNNNFFNKVFNPKKN